MLGTVLEIVVYKILKTGLKCEVNTKILDKCIGIINLVSQNVIKRTTAQSESPG